MEVVLRLFLSVAVAALTACAPPGRVATGARPAGAGDGAAGARLPKAGDVPRGQLRYLVAFVNERRGWLVNDRNLWRTENGGRDWELLSVLAEEAGQVEAVRFLDEREGWLLTLRRLYRTKDGGRTWEERTVGRDASGGGPGLVFKTLDFTRDGQSGWLGGGSYEPASDALRGAIFYTRDGGETWRRQPLKGAADTVGAVSFADSMRGAAVSEGYAAGGTGVFHTEDGGATWRGATFGRECTDRKHLEGYYDIRYVTIFFADTATGWLSFNDGRVAKSIDGGRTWCDLLPAGSVWARGEPLGFFLKLHFADAARGWGLGGDGSLLQSSDGGLTWSGVEKGRKFDDMQFVNAHRGWAVSRDGVFNINF